MKVLVTYSRDGVMEAALRARRPDLDLRVRAPEQVTEEDLAWADTLVGFRRPPVAGWGNLRWIHCIGAGVDGFLFRTDLPASILLTRTSEDYGPAIGEFTLARVLAQAQRLRFLQREQADRRWSPVTPMPVLGTKALVVGTGLVGLGIARLLHQAGCLVEGLSRRGAPKAPFARVRPLSAFAEAVQSTAWLILAAPLTEATYHLLDRDRLQHAGGAYLINVGRGALVDETVLPEAIDRGWLSGAALDVFEVEPLSPDSALWTHPEITISPHVAGLTNPHAAVDGFLECLAAVEHGLRPRWTVDRERGY